MLHIYVHMYIWCIYYAHIYQHPYKSIMHKIIQNVYSCAHFIFHLICIWRCTRICVCIHCILLHAVQAANTLYCIITENVKTYWNFGWKIRSIGTYSVKNDMNIYLLCIIPLYSVTCTLMYTFSVDFHLLTIQ